MTKLETVIKILRPRDPASVYLHAAVDQFARPGDSAYMTAERVARILGVRVDVDHALRVLSIPGAWHADR